MTNTPLNPALAELAELFGSVDMGSDASRLQIRVTRLLARGHPVRDAQVAGVVDELGIDKDRALGHLTAYAERDDNGDIIGVAPGITLRPTTHRFTTDTAQVWAWCVPDTLILPVVLNQEARVETAPPQSPEVVRFTATPHGIFDVEPAGVVVSMPGLVPGTNQTDGRHLAIDMAEITTVEQIWSAFCHHAHAFTSLAQAQESLAGRDDIRFLSLSEAFSVIDGFADRLLGYE